MISWYENFVAINDNIEYLWLEFLIKLTVPSSVFLPEKQNGGQEYLHCPGWNWYCCRSYQEELQMEYAHSTGKLNNNNVCWF